MTNKTSLDKEDTVSIDSIDLSVANQDWINNMTLSAPTSIGAIESITVAPSGKMSGVYSISGGANGAVLGSNGYSYNTWNTNTTTTPMTVQQSGRIDLKGDSADIVVNGESMMDKLNTIAERLNMLRPNPELETEWDQLKALGDQYRELEKQLKEKSKMWKTLKAMPPPTID